MANEQQGPKLSLLANADLSASQYCGVTVNASGKVVLPSAGGSIVGVLYNKPTAANKAAAVYARPGDQVIIVAGGTISAGDSLKVDANGKFVTASAGDIAAGSRVGICTEGATNGNKGSMIILQGGATTAVSGYETITTGAASLTKDVTQLSTTGTQAYTLANGLFAGQRKTFVEITAATSPLGTLTIATPFGTESATHVFHATKQELEFEWTGAAWRMIRKVRQGTLAVVVGTTVLTGFDLAAIYNLSVTGTVSSTATMSIPNGTMHGEMISIRTGTAASLPNGNINITATTVAGAAATNLAGINATTCTAQMTWTGATWQALVLNTLTLS